MDWISVLGLLGVGGVCGTFFRILWERKNAALLQKQEFKVVRYKCLILLMYGYLEYKDNKDFLIIQRPDISSKEKLFLELKTEWHNMILFASDEVLVATHNFIEKPTPENFKKSALAMRKDLWEGKLSSKVEELVF